MSERAISGPISRLVSVSLRMSADTANLTPDARAKVEAFLDAEFQAHELRRVELAAMLAPLEESILPPAERPKPCAGCPD